MQLSALQIVLLVLVAAEINVDRRGLSLTHARPVIVGFLCGLILGDMNSGLYIGGTFTLMSLGVAALGGSSVPDYGVATIIACAFAKTTGQGPEVGMTIGLPVGMLGVQMDVLFKICNSFIAQKSQKYANEKQFGKTEFRSLPEIHFVLDQSIEYGVNMSKLIDDVVRSDEGKEHEGEEDNE